MAPKALGFEDFVVLEEWKGKRNPSNHQTPHIHYPQHQMNAPKREAALNSNDAAKMYGGLLIVDYRRNKNPPRREATDCFEAAQKYGGVLLVDNRYKTQPLHKQA